MPERHDDIDDKHPEFDRSAVLAIEGGGVYGLNMLGQLSAVVDFAGIAPLAIAGTSAGAVVATLHWAGYASREIRDLFVELAVRVPEDRDVLGDHQDSLVDLLGAFEDPPTTYSYQAFRLFAHECKSRKDRVAKALNGPPATFPRLLWRTGPVRRVRVACIVGSSACLAACAIGYSAWALGLPLGWSALMALVFSTCAVGWVASRVVRILASATRGVREAALHAYPRRGFFAGDRFEAFLDEKLKSSPRFEPFRDELGAAPLTFGAVRELQRKHPASAKLDVVPLILTATNLTSRRLVLITSYQAKFYGLSIAKAIRASAGFPVFFRPVEIEGGEDPGWYVDGGVISNFPAWVFSRGLRQTMLATDRYANLATRPWLNVGLRVVSDPPPATATTPIEFLRAAIDLARGHVRNELEKALTSSIPRTFPIEQPKSETNAPPDILDIHCLTDDKIRAMFQRGVEFAEEDLEELSFGLPSGDDEGAIERSLQTLIAQIARVFDPSPQLGFRFRANIFLPRDQELGLRYSLNMIDDPDRRTRFAFNAGLTGTCYTGGRPYICNLKVIRAWAESCREFEATQLGMTPAHHLAIPADRTWLMSAPIFDPQDSWFLDECPPRTLPEEGTFPIWSEFPAEMAGAIFGVLNVDGNIDYAGIGLAENTEDSLKDVRISSTLGLLKSCAIEVARVLSRNFAKGA